MLMRSFPESGFQQGKLNPIIGHEGTEGGQRCFNLGTRRGYVINAMIWLLYR